MERAHADRPRTLPAGHTDHGNTATLAAPGPTGRPPTLLLPLLGCSSPPQQGGAFPEGCTSVLPALNHSLQSTAWPGPDPTCWRGTIAEKVAEESCWIRAPDLELRGEKASSALGPGPQASQGLPGWCRDPFCARGLAFLDPVSAPSPGKGSAYMSPSQLPGHPGEHQGMPTPQLSPPNLLVRVPGV